MHRSPVRALLVLLTAALATSALAACGDGGTGPAGAPDRLEIVAGDQQSDTVLATLSSPIVVQATAAGRPVRGARVYFTAAEGCGAPSVESALTDGDGRASTTWALGTVAKDGCELYASTAAPVSASGTSAATVTTSGLSLATLAEEAPADTALATAMPGLPLSVSYHTAPVELTLGESLDLHTKITAIYDQHGNEIPTDDYVPWWTLEPSGDPEQPPYGEPPAEQGWSVTPSAAGAYVVWLYGADDFGEQVPRFGLPLTVHEPTG